MDHSFKIGDVVALNFAFIETVHTIPKMVVRDVNGDFVECNYFSSQTQSFQSEKFHKHQLTLIK